MNEKRREEEEGEEEDLAFNVRNERKTKSVDFFFGFFAIFLIFFFARELYSIVTSAIAA